MWKGRHYTQIPYCENPTVGSGAPECDESCCRFGYCLKRKENKDNELNFVIDDKSYSTDEIIKILKKHKEEEDKKYNKCERCGSRYLKNNTFNMVSCSMDEKPKDGCAWGYISTPYIRGFQILSTSGNGREVKLCDDCVGELMRWLKNEE